jgi:hypothetical protein
MTTATDAKNKEKIIDAAMNCKRIVAVNPQVKEPPGIMPNPRTVLVQEGEMMCAFYIEYKMPMFLIMLVYFSVRELEILARVKIILLCIVALLILLLFLI